MLNALLGLIPNPTFAMALATFIERLPAALGVTLRVTAGAAAIALVLGTLVALGRSSQKPVRAAFFAGIIYVGRCIPLPPLQLLVYFFFLSLLPIEASVAGMIAIGLNFMPYVAEILRAGIATVPKSQVEAAEALGLSDNLVRRRVIVPLAIRIVLPAVGQLVIAMLLNSAYVSQIGARDITGMGRNIINAMFSTDLWLVVAVTYFIVAFPISRFLSWLEKRLTIGL